MLRFLLFGEEHVSSSCNTCFSTNKVLYQDGVLKALAYSSWMIHRAIEICDHGELVLSRRDAKEVSSSIHQHLRSYQFLATSHGVEPAMALFRMPPKLHYLFHTARQTQRWRLNPFLSHCFEEESWLGRIKRIARQCHGATILPAQSKRALKPHGDGSEAHHCPSKENQQTCSPKSVEDPWKI